MDKKMESGAEAGYVSMAWGASSRPQHDNLCTSPLK